MEEEVELEFEKIVSQSGMTHYVNPNPHPPGGTFKFAGHRRRTWCDFHIDTRIETEPNGLYCQFCAVGIADHERRMAVTGKPAAA